MTAKVLENIGSVDNLQGFSDLKPEDQKRVEAALEQGYVPECKEAEEKVCGANTQHHQPFVRIASLPRILLTRRNAVPSPHHRWRHAWHRHAYC